MINNVLSQRNERIRVKSVAALGLIALAILLPQLVHMAAGKSGGAMFLPMYLPVILSGFILGSFWGLGIAVVAPILSYFLTLSIGTPMPTLERLPFMILELSIFAFITGLFSKKISVKNVLIGLLLAIIIGRFVFLLSSFIFQSNMEIVFEQMKIGLIGIAIQIILVPSVILVLDRLIKNEERID